jgi:pimeloyl-ACP methyl ester carboxylesterase
VDSADPAAVALERIYGQSVDWGACTGYSTTMECAQIEVPLNWDEPSGDTVTVAVARIATADPDSRRGSLVINPGGPGVSGIDYLDWLASAVSQPVRDVYDLVSFDPRGVGASTPVDCVDDPELDEYMAESFAEDPAGLAEAAAEAKEFGQACHERTGDLLGFVDTASAARDMDVIRAVMGDSKLNYLGFSYGTLLGATYAELFPAEVGRLVLDGAIDPSTTAAESDFNQIVAFDHSLAAFASWCAGAATCPAGSGAEGILASVVTLLDGALAKPLPTSYGRELTQSLALMGILEALYSETMWPALGEALTAAFQGRGDELMVLADEMYHRDSATGRYADNMAEAIIAVNCLDAPVDGDMAAMEAAAAELRAAAPVLGQFAGYGALTCANWPFPARGTPHAVTAAGAAPILVVGTTGDPATPYEEAVALADQLESGVLLTYEGEQHTAYGSSNQCVATAVDDYLIEGTVPAEGLRC